MKTIRKSQTVPDVLQKYCEEHPQNTEEHTWKKFRGGRARRDAIAEQRRADQRGICAYCELSLLPKVDFQVEHFHPKSDPVPMENYWQLRWENLLGCCSGGNVNFVQEDNGTESAAARRAASKTELHCGQIKGDVNLDGVILNPLKIPPNVPLFTFRCDENSERLEIVANKEVCDSVVYEGVRGCYDRAVRTIEKLNLNSNVLCLLRYRAYQKLSRQILDSMSRNITLEECLRRLAEMAFPTTGDWPMFFSVVRNRLGQAAERRLMEIEYRG